MTCRLCGNDGAEMVSGEVEAGAVGVTVMKTLGYMCPVCGPHMMCEMCGSWDYEECPMWCQVVRYAPMERPI